MCCLQLQPLWGLQVCNCLNEWMWQTQYMWPDVLRLLRMSNRKVEQVLCVEVLADHDETGS